MTNALEKQGRKETLMCRVPEVLLHQCRKLFVCVVEQSVFVYYGQEAEIEIISGLSLSLAVIPLGPPSLWNSFVHFQSRLSCSILSGSTLTGWPRAPLCYSAYVSTQSSWQWPLTSRFVCYTVFQETFYVKDGRKEKIFTLNMKCLWFCRWFCLSHRSFLEHRIVRRWACFL